MKMHYLKLSVVHPDYAATIKRLGDEFTEATGGNQLSINASTKKTQAWLKVLADHGVTGDILLADLPEDRVDEVRAEISAPTWADRPERRPGAPA